MAKHMWIEGVLLDILEYARKNGLTMTQLSVSDAISAFSEDAAEVCERHGSDVRLFDKATLH